MRLSPTLLLSALAVIAPCSAAESDFVPLFDGHSLAGWVQHGGEAKYTIEGDAIVGTAVAKTPNSFLCTEREYGNFVLEVDLKVDDELNSGIQIRSHVYDKESESEGNKIAAGRVHGYQVEIDPSDRGFSGGIYDEARRGWLFSLEGEERQAARRAFKRGEWNHYRIEARGDSIKTWVNGVPIADLTDDVDASGLIALQVHSVSDDLAGMQVRWRNIRILDLDARRP